MNVVHVLTVRQAVYPVGGSSGAAQGLVFGSGDFNLHSEFVGFPFGLALRLTFLCL